MSGSLRVVLAFDKFRGTATSAQLAEIGATVASARGWQSIAVPLADGGEGSLEVLGGANKVTEVSDPLGRAVTAGWRLEGQTAFIEMAAASGLDLVDGADNNEPLQADTAGTGQLIAAAVELGAREVVVFLGGSATTDGGLAAIETMPSVARLKEIDLRVACDVETSFVDAAEVFGPQKGATRAQVKLLTRRLERLVDVYRETYDVDVSILPGAGAAGGLAGGLAAVGARLESGFEILADRARLDEHLEGADLVLTGEGKLDQGSFGGKVVGGVFRWATEARVPVVAIVGQVDEDVDIPEALDVRSLTSLYGLERAADQTADVVAEQVDQALAAAE